MKHLRIALLLCLTLSALPLWGQSTKKMNTIKKSSLYLYAEATMESAEEAYEVANDLLLIQVKEYAASKRSLQDKDILVKNIQGQRDSLQIKRGDMVKVFLYVRKSDIVKAESGTVIEKEEVAAVKEQKTSSAPITAEEVEKENTTATAPASADASLKLSSAWQQAAVESLLGSSSFAEAKARLSRMKAEFKIQKTGPMSSCSNPAKVYLLVGKGGNVVTVLGPGTSERTDFKTLQKTTDTYDGYEKVWFTFSK